MVLEDRGGTAVLFGTDPDVPVGPEGEGAELDYGGVCVRDGVADGEGGGVVDSDVAAEAVEDAGGFEGHEFGVGALGDKSATWEREN